ncbi:MAG: ATP-binding protein [bacterium]
MIERKIGKILKSKEGSNKALIILGARQTGKTTLLKMLYGKRDDVVWLNGDEPDTQSMFENITSTRLKAILAGKKIVVIDEAQRIRDIGLKLKLITDNIPEVQVIASGSSSFDLANFINEPLTGRKWEFQLYPLSFAEMAERTNFLDELRLLPHRMVFGYYPEVVNSAGNEKEVLKQLSESYLYKDIFTWENIKKPEKLMKLLQAIAFQVGSEVSANELSKMVGLNNETVEKYIQLLEQTYILSRLGSFSRNLRSELKRARKIYFYDNGIRNSIIANFAPVELRNDVGQLWENFLISERLKHLQNSKIFANRYFWRTVEQQEIDYIEEIDGTLYAYQFKWGPGRRAYLPKTFANNYPDHQFKVINRENFETFIS